MKQLKQLTGIGDRIGEVDLRDVDGNPVDLDTLLGSPPVVPMVRYYGCMPCRSYMEQLDQLRPELEAAGVAVVGVGGAADYQARHLMDEGIGFPLLLDPDH